MQDLVSGTCSARGGWGHVLVEEEPIEEAAHRSTWGCWVLAEGESSSTLHAYTGEIFLQGTQ